jgi:hypothetical protein
MLKQQSIPVGDVDVIANAIDRQKVSGGIWKEKRWERVLTENYNIPLCAWVCAWTIE